MTQYTRTQLEDLKAALIKSGGVGGKTTAEDLRTILTALIDSYLNILDDANEVGGFLLIDLTTGKVDISFIKADSPTGQYLKDDGTWNTIPSAVDSLGYVPLNKAGDTFDDAGGVAVLRTGNANGTDFGGAPDNKIGFYGAVPIVKQDTSVGTASYSAGSGTALKTGDTFGGYTLQQITQALINLGLLT